MSPHRASRALPGPDLPGTEREAEALGVPRWRPVLWADFAGQQAAWWWCVLFARNGHAAAALVGPALYAGAHLLTRPGARCRLAALGVGGALLGFLGDTLLVRAGLLSFTVPGASPGHSPSFMVALWTMFALSFSASSAPLSRQRPATLAGLAALAGPLAYLGGERLSLLSLTDGALAAVALEWALLVPLLGLGARRWILASAEVRP
jgi:Protein of unknown function (DUF2878)